LSTAAFVLDFLCIHPFLDGNGRLARLLTTLLLYKAGFNVGRYVGVERLVENTKSSYYESLRGSSEQWHEGTHSLLPWWEYFLAITLAAYEQLDQRLGGGEMPSKAER
jgi:Fic family protein